MLHKITQDNPVSLDEFEALHARSPYRVDAAADIRAAVAREVLADILRFVETTFKPETRQPAKQTGREREPSYTRREAYLWMLGRAVLRDGLTSDGYRVSRDYVLGVEAGEFSRARSEMGTIWNWSEKAVRTLLIDLETMGEVTSIKPVDDDGRYLHMQRVPMSYRLNRVVRWFENARAGVVDGVGLATASSITDHRSSCTVPRGTVPGTVRQKKDHENSDAYEVASHMQGHREGPISIGAAVSETRRAYRLNGPVVTPLAPTRKRKPAGGQF